MSLSHESVKPLVNDRFVAAWYNLENDPAAGKSVRHPKSDQARDMARGLGEHNMQLLVLTPQGRIVNALAGYIGPADLREELQFSLAQLEAMRKTAPGKRARLLAKAHQDFAAKLAKRAATEEEKLLGIAMMAIGPARGVADHRFVAARPLLPVQSFTTALMVGNASSQFVSQVNGSPALLNGKLPAFPGGGDPRQALEKLLPQLDPQARQMLEKMLRQPPPDAAP